jgi:hypothetical protein
MTQEQIAEHLQKKGLQVSRQTVGRDIQFIKDQWIKETNEDVSVHVARCKADLDNLELEAAILYAQFKGNKDSPVNSKEANRWIETQIKIIKLRMDLLDLDKLTSIAAKKLEEQARTSDDKILDLKTAILSSIEKRKADK